MTFQLSLLLFCFVLAAPVLLGAVLRPALQYVDGGRRELGFLFAAIVGTLLDVLIARTTYPLILGWPRWNELTVSQSLQRIVNEGVHPRLHWAVYISQGINKVSPTGSHIDLSKLNHGNAIHA